MVVACLGGGGVYRDIAGYSRDFFGGVRIWNIQSAVFVPTVSQPWSPSPLVDGRGRRLGLRQEVSQHAVARNQRLDLLLEFLDAVWKVCRNLHHVTTEREAMSEAESIDHILEQLLIQQERLNQTCRECWDLQAHTPQARARSRHGSPPSQHPSRPSEVEDPPRPPSVCRCT